MTTWTENTANSSSWTETTATSSDRRNYWESWFLLKEDWGFILLETWDKIILDWYWIDSTAWNEI